MRNSVFVLLFLITVSVASAEKTLLVLGDSLSTGYGIDMDRGWVSLLNERLEEQGYNYRVVNSSVSGDTTRGALTRLEQTLTRMQPDIAIVELGGNDGLRGLPLDEMHKNLSRIIDELRESGSRVLLIPIQLPPNYGPAYNTRFRQIYRQLAENEGVTLGRFILDGIADQPHLMQDDGIHPQVEAQEMMLDNLWPHLETMLTGESGED